MDFFRDTYGKRPNVNVESPDVQINIHVNENKFTVFLDSSGYSLHKRGYKVSSVDAFSNK